MYYNRLVLIYYYYSAVILYGMIEVGEGAYLFCLHLICFFGL